MKEDLLHFIWKNVLYNSSDLHTTDGLAVSVIKHGDRNSNAGPDFFNAKIQIGETVWAGNVEIHTRSSDWKRHGHHFDTVYDSVILHVVQLADDVIARTNETIIPTLVLDFDKRLLETFDGIFVKNNSISCAPKLSSIESIILQMWFDRMLIERLEYKTAMVSDVLNNTTSNWEGTFYRLLFRSFGFNVNAQAFETLSVSLPLSVIAKHTDSVFQIEALLFGQAGMLEIDCSDEYFISLQSEYHFLKSKYDLQAMNSHSWKFMRMRPANFPTIRLAQLAQLMFHSSALLSKVIECENVVSLKKLFDVEVSVYWLTHYSFGKSSNFSAKHLGETAIQSILINAIIPVLFHYGKINANEDLCDKALLFLEHLPFESNEITRQWCTTGIDCDNAARSQALIHLYKNYCVAGNCLRCAIGDKLLRLSL